MDKQSLVQITQTLSNLERELIENNGELSPELESAISTQSISKELKIDSYHAILERCKSIQSELEHKIDILSKMSNNVKTVQNRLKSNLKEAMAITGTHELKGELIRFKLSSGGFKVIISNEGLIPVSYFNERLILELDKSKLKADLEAGISIEGCSLEKYNTLRTYPSISSKKIGE